VKDGLAMNQQSTMTYPEKKKMEIDEDMAFQEKKHLLTTKGGGVRYCHVMPFEVWD